MGHGFVAEERNAGVSPLRFAPVEMTFLVMVISARWGLRVFAVAVFDKGCGTDDFEGHRRSAGKLQRCAHGLALPGGGLAGIGGVVRLGPGA